MRVRPVVGGRGQALQRHHARFAKLGISGGLAANIQRNCANWKSLLAYIAAMRTASSTSTATKRETPGSFCVTPTNCEANSMVVLL